MKDLKTADMEKLDEELEPERQEHWMRLTTLKIPLPGTFV
jgi:hypothetical protein